MSEIDFKSVVSIMTQTVEKNAEKAAVIINGEVIDFATLDLISKKILSLLNSQVRRNTDNGITSNLTVGICVKRNRNLIPSIWALVQAGYTYVPLDPENPIERLKFIVEDSGAAFVLCDSTTIGYWDNIKAINVELAASDLRQIEQKVSSIAVHPQQVAYIIYTSGTTGKPKGVPVTYSSLLNLLQVVSRPEFFNISEQSRILGFASIGFDASIIDIMSVFYQGATIVLADENQRRDVLQLHNLIQQERVTIATLPPSLLTLMYSLDFPFMDTLVVAGEKMLPSIVQRTKGLSYRLINAYGPTENTVMSTMRVLCSSVDCENIGCTIPGVVGYVLNSDLTQVEVGEVGELCLGGVQVTSGYMNRPKLNQEKFIRNHFGDSDAPVLYRTGDMVRLMQDGSFNFIGRIDSQVKFQGYRIELDEITKLIEQCEGVLQACVLVATKLSTESLVAYVKFESETIESGIFDRIRRYVKTFLPTYMIPSVWVNIQDFPRTLNGKIDKTKLLEMQLLSQSSVYKPSVVLANRKEEIMTRLVSAILEVDVVDVNSDLFDDLGMTSMQIMQLSMNLDLFGIDLKVADIYAGRTIRKMLQNQHIQKDYWYNEPKTEKPVLVIVSGYPSFLSLYSTFAQKLSDLYSIYVFESYHDEDDVDTTSCEQLVSRYMNALLPIAKKYKIALISGYCVGGELGLLLAHKLHQQIGVLSHVVVLDGEVSRSKIKEEYIPLFMDFLPDKTNEQRFRRDIAIATSFPDFQYEGKITSILASYYDRNISHFQKKSNPTPLQVAAERYFFERNPMMWKNIYPSCELLIAPGDHLDFLRSPENLNTILEYFRSLFTCSNNL